MGRNGPKRTQYKGENVIMQIMSEIFIQSIYFVCFYYRNIFCSIYPLIIAKKMEVRFLARQLGLGSAGCFIRVGR